MIKTAANKENPQISVEAELKFLQKADSEESTSTATTSIASHTKVRVCPKCNKHNAENAWSCVECRTTLSIQSLVDFDNEQATGKKLSNEPSEIHTSSHSSQLDGGSMKKIEQTPSQPVFCGNCGTSLSSDANFCWKCGEKTQSKTNAISLATEQHSKVIQHSSLPFLACPSCGHEDMVSNVDALVQGNTITTRYSGSTSGRGKVQSSSAEFTYGSSSSGSSTTQSTLAGKLDFPSKTSPWTSYQQIFQFLVFIAVPVCSFMLAPRSEQLCIGILITCEIVLIIASFSMNGQIKEKQLKWETAQAYWKQLYYCHRDGTVFDPQTKRKISLPEISTDSKWRDFLFQ